MTDRTRNPVQKPHRSQGLVGKVFHAETLEVEALYDAARREDDDAETDRRREQARKQQDEAYAALAQQVRREVAGE